MSDQSAFPVQIQALPDGGAELHLVVRLRWEDVAALGREAGRLAVRLQRPVSLDEAAGHRLGGRSAAVDLVDTPAAPAPRALPVGVPAEPPAAPAAGGGAGAGSGASAVAAPPQSSPMHAAPQAGPAPAASAPLHAAPSAAAQPAAASPASSVAHSVPAAPVHGVPGPLHAAAAGGDPAYDRAAYDRGVRVPSLPGRTAESARAAG